MSERQPLWLLDEPCTALDKSAVAHLEQLIAAHREQGGMVVTTSHEPPQAAAPGSTRSSCPDVGCIPMCGSARSAARHPAARRRADRNPFFVVVVTLFPLGIGPGLSWPTIAPGVIWVAALLSSMLTLPRLYGRPRRQHARADAFVGFAGGVIVVTKSSRTGW